MHTSLAISLENQRALVTGAGSGIGRAIALTLAEAGVHLTLLGRRRDTLQSVESELRDTRVNVELLTCDLADDAAVAALAARLGASVKGLDILVHCAGAIAMSNLATVAPADVDLQYRVNVRAPLFLTQALLVPLIAARGQVVFVNSSLGVRTKERAGAYAASKHALKAIADTLRMEINPAGVRVLSVFPGNTATPMQERICRDSGARYAPEAMLQPADVATAIVDALRLPRTAELTDLHIRPAAKNPG